MITTVSKFKWIYCFGLMGMEKPFSRPSNIDLILSFEFWYSMTLDNTCRSIYFSRTPICKFLSWKRVHRHVSNSQGYKRWLLFQIKLRQVCSLVLDLSVLTRRSWCREFRYHFGQEIVRRFPSSRKNKSKNKKATKKSPSYLGWISSKAGWFFGCMQP